MKAALFVLLATSACANWEAPLPVTTAATVPERAAPMTSPLAPIQGMVRLATSGVVDMRSDANPSVHARAVHVRATLDNRTTNTWVFDVREQRIVLAGHESAAAFSASTAGNAPPLLTVLPHTSRVVDLLYTLPPELQATREIPPYDVIAWIDAGEHVVVERMPWSKLEGTTLELETPRAGGFASSPTYDYDLFHEPNAFEGTVDVSRRLVGYPMTVRPEPSVHVAP